MSPGVQLRIARSHAGLTQSELAHRVGTSQATISAYEGGHKQPSIDTFNRLLAASGSRLVVESGRRPVLLPSRAQLARSASELSDVLDLAEALPVRHERELRFPRLPSRAGTSA